MSRTVLVTGGEQRAALAIVRSAARAGYRPYVCSSRSSPLAGASRFVAGEAQVPDPLHDATAFVSELGQLVERWAVEVLLPVTDADCTAVLGSTELRSQVDVPFPTIESFREISDKAALMKLAVSLDIHTPQQTVVDSPGQPLDVHSPGVAFPLVIKPSRSVAIDSRGSLSKFGVTYASDPAELDRKLASLPSAAYPLLLQQRIRGPGVGVFLLRWDGEIVAGFSHLRLREKPPSGGVSVYRESIPLDPALAESASRILEHFDWRGVAMVEYKLDRLTGTPYLMEVNGRFWGSLQLAVDAGADFPRLLLDLAGGRGGAAGTTYRPGVRSRWWWGDVDQLLSRLRRSRNDLSLPHDSPGKLEALAQFAVLWRPGDRSEVFRWTDPRPFWRETRAWFRN